MASSDVLNDFIFVYVGAMELYVPSILGERNSGCQQELESLRILFPSRIQNSDAIECRASSEGFLVNEWYGRSCIDTTQCPLLIRQR